MSSIITAMSTVTKYLLVGFTVLALAMPSFGQDLELQRMEHLEKFEMYSIGGSSTSDFSACFLADGSKIANLIDDEGSLSVYECQSGSLVDSKKIQVSSIVALDGDAIAGPSIREFSRWKVWKLGDEQVRELAIRGLNPEDWTPYPRRIVDERTKKGMCVYVSDGEQLCLLNLKERTLKPVLAWEEFAKLYADQRMQIHGNQRLNVTHQVFRRTLPSVCIANEQLIVLVFAAKTKFVLTPDSSGNWTLSLLQANIWNRADGSYLVDTGKFDSLPSPNNIRLDDTDCEPTCGQRSRRDGKPLAVFSEYMNAVVDYPRYKNVLKKRKYEKSVLENGAIIYEYVGPKSPPSEILRITSLDSDDAPYVLMEESNPLLRSIGSVSELRISSCGRFACFRTNAKTKFTNTIVWDLSRRRRNHEARIP